MRQPNTLRPWRKKALDEEAFSVRVTGSGEVTFKLTPKQAIEEAKALSRELGCRVTAFVTKTGEVLHVEWPRLGGVTKTGEVLHVERPA